RRFLLIWAIAPLLVLSLSRGRARPYALPVLPAYACLVVAWWKDTVSGRTLPRWATVALGALISLGSVAIAGSVLAILLFVPRELDMFELAGAILALVAGASWVVGALRDRAFASSANAAVLVALVVVGGFVTASGRLV